MFSGEGYFSSNFVVLIFFYACACNFVVVPSKLSLLSLVLIYKKILTHLSNSQGNAKAGILAIVFSSRKFSGKLSVITPSGVDEFVKLPPPPSLWRPFRRNEVLLCSMPWVRDTSHQYSNNFLTSVLKDNKEKN